MNFGKEYTNYWASAVTKSVDGTVIAGLNEANYFLQKLKIGKQSSVLDLGCSFGRMYEALSIYSDHIYGVDPDIFAVEKASLKPYVEVKQGSAECTGFDAGFFDMVFCWAVFDVVDHVKGLMEINRVMKTGGSLLLTGKNDNYYADDNLAYKAEKNAYLKNFPNKFTDLVMLLENLNCFGFELDELFIFPRRGDFGLLSLLEYGNNVLDEYIGYEYLILCKKISDQTSDYKSTIKLDSMFSKTANRTAELGGYSSAKELFKHVGLD